MDSQLLSILQQTAELFMKYGIKSVTMDDIARHLKMSKKTLYKYVKDKNDLVHKVMEAWITVEQMNCTAIIEGSENAIDELIEISKRVSNEVTRIHPSVHYDMEKYHADAWRAFDSHKNEFILNCIRKNLENGIEEGLYRDNLNAQIISKLYVEKIDMIFDAAIFPPNEFNFHDVHLEMVRYHIRGIASPKGLEYLKERLTKETIQF